MPSDNNLIIRSLTETVKQPPKDEDELRNLLSRVYDLITRMNTDLNEVFNTVFDGPLAAVDGFALTRLNAASLEGEIPESFNIAYTNVINIFTRGQLFINDDDEEPTFQVGFGNTVDPIDPTSYWRMGSLADGEFYTSQNALWNGTGWERDDNAIGSLVSAFDNGQVNLTWWDSVLTDFRGTWSVVGKNILSADFADATELSLVLMDDNDVFHFGEDCATDGISSAGYIAIPAKTTAQLPPTGNADHDGVIAIGKSNNSLVFYHGGVRYRCAGVAFP